MSLVLVDTSIWIDHLRRGDPRLTELLQNGSVLIHNLVIEELACGNLSNRAKILELLEALPKALQISHMEFIEFTASHRLYGWGLGAVDIHLLASARLCHAKLLTRDHSLRKVAVQLNLSTT